MTSIEKEAERRRFASMAMMGLPGCPGTLPEGAGIDYYSKVSVKYAETLQAHLDATMPKAARKTATPSAPRAANPLWDIVAELWFNGTIPTGQQSRAGKIVRDLGELEATPDDVSVRLARYKRRYPNATASPEALLKHWASFDDEQCLLEPTAKTPGDLLAEMAARNAVGLWVAGGVFRFKHSEARHNPSGISGIDVNRSTFQIPAEHIEAGVVKLML